MYAELIEESFFTEFEFLQIIYRAQFIFALIAVTINVLITAYAYAGDSFPPHTVMYRVILTIDVLGNVSYIFDSIAALTENQQSNDVIISPRSLAIVSNSSHNSLFLPSFHLASPQHTPPAEHIARLFGMIDEIVSVSECGTNRPYLFVLLIGRQWSAVIVLIMGFERFLFVIYPLWFNSIRVRRGPIIIFTMLFATLSAGIAYTNSLFVAPEELTHFTCELTWAFGENYGWCLSFFVLVPQILGCVFTFYAQWSTSRQSAFFRFGNNRAKLASERRKIRKAKYIIFPAAIFSVLPQVGAVGMRILSRWNHQHYKILISQLFLLKCFANYYVYRIIGRSRRGIFYAAKLWMIRRQKRRINTNDSITSVSVHVM